MGIKVSADGLSIVTTKSDGKCMATIPDVCKIPGPTSPIPVPFPNMVESKKGKMTSIMTQMNGGKVHCMGSYCEPSTGDEGGILKGIVSGTTKGKAFYMKWSPTVKVEGRPVCRKSDLMIMNTVNTLGLSGMNQEDVGNAEGEDLETETKPFKMQFHENFEPMANTSFVVIAYGKKITGSTDQDGKIDIEIPKNCKSLKIKLGENRPLEIEIQEAAAQGKKAVQLKLANFGLYHGTINGWINKETELATFAFQGMMNEIKGENLKLDGEPGEITEGKIKEVSGE